MAYFQFYPQVLQTNIDSLKTAFDNCGSNFSIFYSVKTNSNELVLKTIAKNCYFEIVSDDEWHKIKPFEPKRVVLNGPSKSLGLVEDILASPIDVLYFNIDNDTDIEVINTIKAEDFKRIKLGLRLHLKRPGIWQRFGYDAQSSITADLLKLLACKLSGIHFHFSTNHFDLQNYRVMLSTISELIQKHKLNLTYIDIGGGLPTASNPLYRDQIYKQLPQLIKDASLPNLEIISEVGRNLIADAMDLKATVRSVKLTDSNHYDISIDSNIMHFPCFWEKGYTIRYESNSSQTQPTHVNIYGNSCMEVDRLADDHLIATKPTVGDSVTLTNMGAYSLSQASNFITKIPDVVSK